MVSQAHAGAGYKTTPLDLSWPHRALDGLHPIGKKWPGLDKQAYGNCQQA